MKKKVWIILIIVVIIAVASAVIVASQKPNDKDFVRWMEDTYGVQCLNYNCDIFEVELTEKGKKTILMQNVHGSYSPGIFVMEVDRTYRKLEDSSYKLDIEIKGFLGEFTIEDEIIKKISKK
ncbi:hypothetical protein [Lysinibacillus sp. SGAir0095]|uniref:hypothetical protein n=1 Tax=Lysinibacillus sp. SGAir0095 TaxID=2070463 RepID=UPI0010CCCA33|nr:hypothetical protein [Lysinibacillus sp. SGAir0095]QCR31918.1 hypothetical protein C1N55_06880 [Lysinibacillus sp. SGAir0095]